MMQNILLVTEHIKKKVTEEGGDPMREAMTVIKREPGSMTDAEKNAKAGDLYYKDASGRRPVLQGRLGQLLGNDAFHRRLGHI